MNKGLVFLLLSLVPAFAQAPEQSGSGVIRISVDLVQVDAVITDSKGRQVTNLKPEDFEILEDGHPQKITNFSYVSLTPAAAPGTPAYASPRVTQGADSIPTVRLRPEAIRRTIALVVDDLGLSFESTVYVRQALKKFVDQQMLPGDLVAILRTAAGMGALQQFTSDKRLLYAAIDRIRWYPMGRGNIGAFAPLGSQSQGGSGQTMGASGRGGAGSGAMMGSADFGRQMMEFRSDIFSIGTLGALNYVIKGLRSLPGRKAVILFSDGVPIMLRVGLDSRVLDSLRALTDLANRSSVLMYAIDARGLQTLGLSAADGAATLSPNQLAHSLENRRADFFDSQQGLAYLAAQTGGLFIHDTNDLNWGVGRILRDLSGYYLIGYKPPSDTFKAVNHGRAFHQIKVKVKVAGLRVRSRTGFYGIPDEDTHPVYHTRGEQLMAALSSPFSSSGVRVNLFSMFTNGGPTGYMVRSLFHIDARDLTFQEQPGGREKLTFDVVVFTFGDNGIVVDGRDNTYSGSVTKEQYAIMLKKGVEYSLDLPLKRPGAYQLRAAVRDSFSERVGSTSQFIEVPNLRCGRLAASAIVLDAKGAGDEGPVLRQFHPGEQVTYGLRVYNSRLDPATQATNLIEQFQLFHHGRQLLAANQKKIELKWQTSGKVLALYGALGLSSKMKPGNYVFQITLTDKLARKRKYSTVTQYIDFEIIGTS